MKRNIRFINMAVIVAVFALVGFGVISVDATMGFGSLGMLAIGFMGTIGVVPPYPDYSTETGTKSIPWIFSKKVLRKFYPKSVISYTSNTEFEG